jgi:predicted amidohydrolase YtcJ
VNFEFSHFLKLFYFRFLSFPKKIAGMLRFLPFCLLLFLTFSACETTEEKADLLIVNAEIATVNPDQPTASAVAVKGDRILWVGSAEEAVNYQGEATTMIDAEGRFLMPGFIEGHGHFSGLGELLLNLNFLESKSWDEIVQVVAEAAEKAEPGEWIEGRGWHQEKWLEAPMPNVNGYPYHDELSALTPDNPVILHHASGHAVYANAAAMKAAGVTVETPSPPGGEIVRNNRGEAVGAFEERAEDLIMEAYMAYQETLSEEMRANRWYRAIELAEEECLSKGVTSFQDAGSKFFELDRYKEMAEKGELDIRLWAMVRHKYKNLVGKLEGYPVKDVGNHFFSSTAIKSEVDGALGAFGAWLLEPYRDKPNFHGQNTTSISDVKNIAKLAMDNDMQLCVHAIGDRANRVVLDIYEEQFKTHPEKEDLRWRIEHAQHLDTADIPRFRELGVIASMQGIHCTSDAPFVVKRLGETRSRLGAYPWRSLLDNGVVIANGTDAPVEDVDPIECFYASVTRKRADNGFEFFPEQRMTREEAIHSYTLGNAYAAFEEDQKGSIEPGKLADFVLLSNNLLTCTDEEILDTKVLMTMVGGVVKYEK